MSILHVSGIGLQEAGQAVLQDISFTQEAFQKIAIAGETGSGKSTLLQIIAGLVQPGSGEVFFNGEKVIGPQYQLIPGHKEIAYLSQDFELPQFLRVEQILQYASKLTTDEAEILYDLCRIRHLLKRPTSQLSGGERQRIALARLLLGAPGLLLLDEPYSNLDVVHKRLLKAVIQDIGEELDITLILISHDPLDTLSWASEILVMQNGKIIQQGTPYQIYQQPVSEYAAALFGSYNLLTAGQAAAFKSIPGLQRSHKNILIRPENLKLNHLPDQGLPGIVLGQTFFGSYIETEVQLSGFRLTIKSAIGPLNKGDTVYISLSPKAIWYL